jgi:uncharacterized protein (TIGR03437 family)
MQQSNMLPSAFKISIGAVAAPGDDGLPPSYTELYHFNITVPDVPAGNAVPLTFTVDGVNGTEALDIAVEN